MQKKIQFRGISYTYLVTLLWLKTHVFPLLFVLFCNCEGFLTLTWLKTLVFPLILLFALAAPRPFYIPLFFGPTSGMPD